MILHVKTKKLLALVCASLLMPASLNSVIAAENNNEKWYEVEVIVFANNDKSLQEAEKWPEKPGSPSIENVLDIFTQDESLFEDIDQIPMYYVEPDEPGEDNLSALADKIVASENYTLLTHRFWRQPTARKSVRAPVYLDDNSSENLYQTTREVEETQDEADSLSAEQRLLEALLAEELTIQQDIPALPFFIHQLDPIVPFDETEGLPVSTPIQLTPMGPPNHALFGTLQFFKNRYLHIGVDFLYRPEPTLNEFSLEQIFPMATDDVLKPLIDNEQTINTGGLLAFTIQEKPPMKGFRLKGSKRIRLKEVHYFDHPTFGLIVRVIPYVQPESEEERIE